MAFPNPFYVLLDGNAVQRIDGADSYTDVVITDYYDTETYRNELAASYVGAANAFIDNSAVLSAYLADFKAKDDRYNATPPFPKQKSRTERQFVDADGDIVGTAWLDQIKSSGASPTFLK